ncbi:MAG: dihydroorotate dehydrogenase electron transfer subunit [Bacteroidetes bacterium]|nr:dihydroorotate dehydrogenase electron transfer subunit [Bacteroidota bacterium]
MQQLYAPVLQLEHLTKEIIELTFRSSYLAETIRPGQFLNIRVDNNFPLLRRPFSVYNVQRDTISIAFNIVGLGSSILAKKHIGDSLDIIGPCGNSFDQFIDGDYDTAILIAGGIGVAPFPLLTASLLSKKNIVTFLGGRTKELLVPNHLSNVKFATDDGSEGMKGTVLDLLKKDLAENNYGKIRFFSCGPSRMMKAVGDFAKELGVLCYASVETSMACGIGICQGCNIETTTGDRKYKLVCCEGTIFETQTIKLT